MLRCTFCNKVFQGTQFQGTRHFTQTNYCKDVNDKALYEIARRTQQKFEADQMERVARYVAERGLDVPDTGGARGGEAGRRLAEGGVGGDGGHGAAEPTLGGGGGETEEGVIHVDCKACGPGEEGVQEREDVPEVYPGTGERLEDWRRGAGKGAAMEGSSKRKEGGSDPFATPAGKRLRQQKVTDVYGGDGVSFNAFRNQAWKAYQQVLLEQPGSSPRAVLPNHCKIASMRAVETHRAELAEELEEVRQPFWVTGATFLSDGRKSRDGRPIVNFLAAGFRGVVVYTTINREGEADDAAHVLRRWVTIFHEFSFGRPQRINAICTDSASAYVGAARALTSPSMPPALRRITWLPCSVHVERYDAWLVGQGKRYILTQTGFELEGAEYILACRQFEDFHIQQGKFRDWGGPEGRARGRACSGDSETIECASWWSQFGSGAPKLQRCALRVMHMWSCASPAERNWAVHEGIHMKKRNQLALEKVVQLIEITANVRLTEYRRAGCGYVLPWQRDEGMLDCQAGLELEPVRSGTRRGMTEEEIARQVALITRDPIGASAPPSTDVVSDRRDCIFRPYPREDDSDEEPIPEAADDHALHIPREIDETHDDPDSEETRAHTARRAADRTEREMLGGDEDLWGPFGEVASTGGPEAQATTSTPTRRDSSMPPPPAPTRAPPSPVSPLQPDREELESSLPRRSLLHRGGAEEGAPSAAAVESSAAPAAVSDVTIAAAVEEIAAAATTSVLEEMAASVLEEDPPAAGGGAAVEGQVAAAGGAGGEAAAVEVEVAAAAEEEEAPSTAEVEEEIAAQAEVQRGGNDERLMQQFLTEELDPAIAGITPNVKRGFGISDSEMGTHLDLDLSVGLPPSCAGATSTDRAPSRDETPGRTSTQTARERTLTESPDAAHDIMERERARLLASTDPRAQAFARAVEEDRCREIGGDCVQGRAVGGEDVVHRQRGVSTETLEYALRAATRAVQEQTPRLRGVPPRPRPVPAEGGATFGKSSGAEGLGMPRGSRHEQTIAEASAGVVVLRKGGGPVTIEEDDPDTDVVVPPVRDVDEDYEGEEGGEEDSRSGSDGDDDDDYDEPPPPQDPHRRVHLDAPLHGLFHPHEGGRSRHPTLEGARGYTAGRGRKVVDR
ncbi:hypothetical protein CBR_g53789 [Chara braunii]|uniref:Uncharacterized protein n=1 Tax=Chara braunii TaxID=69332 RepID=A0A388K6Z5_CHABU|nr:hypothetical protein CBR_g53789 [Chara braunii]|eukprot:GBG65818.1 hypothetical protein CBR_g53789 [Chara braunii]